MSQLTVAYQFGTQGNTELTLAYIPAGKGKIEVVYAIDEHVRSSQITRNHPTFITTASYAGTTDRHLVSIVVGGQKLEVINPEPIEQYNKDIDEVRTF